MPPFDPRSQFPGFYDNPAIASIADHQLWTVSDKNKRPIDIQNALAKIDAAQASVCDRCGYLNCSEVHGAQLFEAHNQLLTLNKLTDRMPTAANTAVHLDTVVMNVMVLDIEPDCPPPVTDQLLRLVTGNAADPHGPALYSELSSSGNGYHLILPIPSSATSMPDLFGRTKIQHPQRWYEVLLHHWITFSRNPIPQSRLDAALTNPDGDHLTWDAVLAQLHHQAPHRPPLGAQLDSARAASALDEELTEDEAATLANAVTEHRTGWSKELYSEFYGDTSRWEYAQAIRLSGMIGQFYDRIALTRELTEGRFTQPEPMATDRMVVLVYLALGEVLPYRDKHDQLRDRVPYLLKRAASAVADAVPTP